MNLPGRKVKLSDGEFNGIMTAVARRINRTANFGHPDASVDGSPPPQIPITQDWSQMFQPQAQGGIGNAESTQGS